MNMDVWRRTVGIIVVIDDDNNSATVLVSSKENNSVLWGKPIGPCRASIRATEQQLINLQDIYRMDAALMQDNLWEKPVSATPTTLFLPPSVYEVLSSLPLAG